MIYDIYRLEDYTNSYVVLHTAVEDFDDVSYKVFYTLDNESDKLVQLGFQTSTDGEEFDSIAADKVPRWVRVMAMRMQPRVEDVLRGRTTIIHEFTEETTCEPS